MKNILKLSFSAFLTLFSVASFSQSVVKVVENIEANFYVRTQTLKKVGTTVDFWQIIDYKQAKVNKKGEQYLSTEFHQAIDCSSNTQTLIFVKVYSSSMLTGTLLANGPTNQKYPIPTGTTLEEVRNFVCK